MANMPNDFWSGWIIILTSISFIGLLWLVISIFILPAGKDHQGEEPVWDSSLREGSNRIPLWWFWLILTAMVISVIYLMLYPGMGSFQGAFLWSQGGQLSAHKVAYELEFAAINDEILSSSYTDLASNPLAMESAASLFAENCSACHGSDARGQASLFPNLKDSDWQWGGNPEQIEQTLRNGRMANMISWQAVLNDEGISKVSSYVVSMASGIDPEHEGKTQYDCFA